MYHVFHTWIDPEDPWTIWVDPYQDQPDIGWDDMKTLKRERRVTLNHFCATHELEFIGWNPALTLLGVFRNAA